MIDPPPTTARRDDAVSGTTSPIPTPRIACSVVGMEEARPHGVGAGDLGQFPDSDHLTMRSRSGGAKGVAAKYPFCGVENCPMW